jgi:putative peptidoglycan lipid II flippase
MKRISIFVMAVTLLSNVLGLFREIVVAFLYGATYQTDALNIAMFLPETTTSWFSVILSGTFIPIYLRYKNNTLHSSELLRDTLFWLCIIISVIICAVMMGSTEFIVKEVAPGFTRIHQELSVLLAKLLIPAIVFSATLNICTGLLHCKNEFISTAFLGVVNNAAVIIVAILLSSYWGIYGFACAYLAGSVARFIYVLLYLKKVGEIPRFQFDLSHPGIKNIAFISIPIAFSVAFGQTQALIDRLLGSNLNEGALSLLYYAKKVTDVPVQVIGGTVAAMFFPKITNSVVENKPVYDRNAVIYGAIKSIMLLTLPVVFLVNLYKKEIITVLYQYGEFNEYATLNTSIALGYLIVGSLASCIYLIVTQVHLAAKKTYIPLITTLLALCCYYLVSTELLESDGYLALAKATIFSIYTNVTLSFILIPGKIEGKLICILECMKLIIINGAIFGGLKLLFELLDISLMDDTKLTVLFIIVLGTAIYIVLYGLCLRLLKYREVDSLISFINGKWKSNKR